MDATNDRPDRRDAIERATGFRPKIGE